MYSMHERNEPNKPRNIKITTVNKETVTNETLHDII